MLINFCVNPKDVKDPREQRQEYHLRIATEERYRQVKCFIDLTKFTSRAFSMVTNQVVFTMLAYNLLQLHLFRQRRKKLNQKTLPYIRQQLLPSDNHIIVYHQNYYALFRPFELVQFPHFHPQYRLHFRLKMALGPQSVPQGQIWAWSV